MKRITFLFFALIIVPGLLFSQENNTLTTKEKKKGWILLFDGNNTSGWTTTRGLPVPPGWDVSNGCISTKKGDKGGDIISVSQYSEFDLKLDFKIEPGCNSGVKYFFTKYENGGNLGMEYQIIDDVLGEDNKLANHLCGSLYDVLPPDESKKQVNPPNSWNSVRIVAKAEMVEHYLNGIKILEYRRGSQHYKDAVAKSKFSKSVPPFGMVKKGHILLQEHGGVISFRNIKIRNLSKK
jgi:hypothetical protein